MLEVIRREEKYLVTEAEAAKLCGRLSALLASDEHGGPHGYPIRSLYFDTPDDRDFRDKVDGLETRRKVRLRTYGASTDVIKLEHKQKQGDYQRKRSLLVTEEEARRLIAADFSPLLARREPFAAELYGLMSMGCYRPKTVVEYRRRAFVARENRIRITVDRRIEATEANFDLFAEDLALAPVMSPFHAVVEVKYNGFLPSYVKDMIGCVNRTRTSLSKYCLGRRTTLPGLQALSGLG